MPKSAQSMPILKVGMPHYLNTIATTLLNLRMPQTSQTRNCICMYIRRRSLRLNIDRGVFTTFVSREDTIQFLFNNIKPSHSGQLFFLEALKQEMENFRM